MQKMDLEGDGQNWKENGGTERNRTEPKGARRNWKVKGRTRRSREGLELA